MPASAARPVPTMTAVGVARPIAHGQAMTTTAMNAVRASVIRGSGPAANQTTNVATPTTRTNGTKTSLIRSASRWIGALEPCARWTSSTIEARTVSRPTRVARITTVPDALSVAPMRLSPGPFSTGSGSPGEHRLVDRGPALPRRCRRPAPSRRVARGAGRRHGPPRAGRPPRGRPRAGAPSAAGGRSIGGWRRSSGPLARASSHRPSSTRPMMIVELSK